MCGRAWNSVRRQYSLMMILCVRRWCAVDTRRCTGCCALFEPRTPKGKFSPKKRFCTQKCWITYYNATDQVHAIQGGEAAAEAIVQKYANFESTKKTYKKVRGRHEHRIVAERMLGRKLLRDEHVHHIDGNKRNNTPSNLQVLTSAEHLRLHALERRNAA